MSSGLRDWKRRSILSVSLYDMVCIRNLGLLLGVLSIGGLMAAAQVPGDSKPDVVVHKRYERNGSLSEVLAVCRLNADSGLECWNADGVPDSALTGEVRAKVQKLLANTYASLQIRPGWKNRYIYVRSVSGADGLAVSYSVLQAPLSLESRTRTRGGEYEREEWQLVPIAADPAQAEGSVRLAAQAIQQGSEANLTPRVGAEAKVGTAMVRIASIERVPWDPLGKSKVKDAWRVLFRGEGLSSEIQIAPWDTKRGYVGMVDYKGRLLSVEETIRQNPVRDDPQPLMNSLGIRMIYSAKLEPGPDSTAELLSPIDPAKIPYFHVSDGRQITIEIAGLPLDPKP